MLHGVTTPLAIQSVGKMSKNDIVIEFRSEWHAYCVIIAYLFSVKYKDAFDCMRRHRINLNLIYDHNCKVTSTLSCIAVTFAPLGIEAS